MQTEQLQQNMKEKVKVFEDGGIRLLKKGQSGLVHAIFSRFGLVLVLLLLQFGGLFALLRWFPTTWAVRRWSRPPWCATC